MHANKLRAEAVVKLVACELGLSSQFKHSPRAFDDGFYRSENTDEYSICMTVIYLINSFLFVLMLVVGLGEAGLRSAALVAEQASRGGGI